MNTPTHSHCPSLTAPKATPEQQTHLLHLTVCGGANGLTFEMNLSP